MTARLWGFESLHPHFSRRLAGSVQAQNMISALQKQTDGTISLTITIPSSEVKKAWDKAVEETVKNTTLPGFRKGKAPQELVEEKLDKEKIREETLRELLPKHYVQAVNKHQLRPIMNPKIHVAKLEDQKDCQFTAQTCEAPDINLGKYKEAVKSVTAKSKIIVPGKEKQEPKFDEITRALLEAVSASIPKILIEAEVDRLLSQMLDEIKKLGLTLDQYLSSTGRTVESLREEYRKKAENDIKLEFTLQKIAEVEKITVEEKEIEEAIQKGKDEKEKQALSANKYLLASILRQQKTLDFLKNL